MVRVAINGFGRIGRTFMRSSYGNRDFEIVAINDLGSLENLAYLLKYDSAYGRSPFSVEVKEGKLLVDGKEIAFIQEKEPENLPWKDLNVDVVMESTGFFTKYEGAKKHLTAGAKKVVVSAPMKDEPGAGINGGTVLMGVNEEMLKTCDISSNASCTTNATSPLIAILKEAIGIEKALLNTVHAYTSTQSLIDSPSRGDDMRKSRAAALNIIPSTTGAAIATTKAHPELEGKFDGMALRVPVPVGSIVDVTFIASRDTTKEEVNEALRKAATDAKWKGIFAATDEQVVSSDIIGSRVGSIADLSFTNVVGGNLVKVLAWYDNETSYTETLVKHVAAVAKNLK